MSVSPAPSDLCRLQSALHQPSLLPSTLQQSHWASAWRWVCPRPLSRACCCSELGQSFVLFWPPSPLQPHTCSSPESGVPPQLLIHSLAQGPVCWTLFPGA